MDSQTQAHGHNELHVIVFAPRAAQPKDFTWSRTLKVGEAARDAANSFGYKAGNPGLQTDTNPPKVLDKNKTLEQEGVRNGEKLELIDTGGGVSA